MAKVYIKTYGCQMNERDSEQVAAQLVARGHVLTTDPGAADVILLNTCSVRDMAEQKAVNKMRGYAHDNEKGRRNRVLGFLGCMAQSRGDQLLKELPGVNMVVGTQKFHRVAEYVDKLLEAGELERICDTEAELDSQNTIRDQILDERQVTSFVSIMQGCNMHCTFCIVPFTRGEERSRPIEQIVQEVRTYAARGVKEVTLLGQIVNLYGRHEFETKRGLSPFVQLLEAVHDIDGIERIRFTSPHPIGFKQDLVDAYARLPKLCQHAHLPLQSGSNRLLKAMHRAYTVEKYMELVGKLRAARADIGLTTDIIVGFPGESDEDFEASRNLLREADFDNSYIFRYSKRKDTPAAAMAEELQIPESVKEERNQILLEDQRAIARRKTAQFVGHNVEILIEGPSKTNENRFSGRTRQNHLVVVDGAGTRHVGQIAPVRVTETTGFTLYADIDIHQD